MDSVYALSWDKSSFLAKAKLFFKSLRKTKQARDSNEIFTKANGYSALSSTYYSTAATAYVQLDKAYRNKWLAIFRIAIWAFSWAPLGVWCYIRMLPLSNRVVLLIGYQGMTADQCDIRQSILRKRGKLTEAKWCIEAGLAKNPKKNHTRGLLYAAFAEIYHRAGESTQGNLYMELAMQEAAKTKEYDVRQAMRIYRQCANITSDKALLQKARALAEAADVRDQYVKI